MAAPSRISSGVLTDPSRPLGFRFDGRELQGLTGDTLASALLANGVQQIGRSFKYHRPRGIVTAGAEEPCALVDVIDASGREPNRLATTLPLREGLNAESQNRWPTLRFDLGASADRLAVVLFLLLGWSGVSAYDSLASALPSASLSLLAIGGILYSVGALFHVWRGLRFQNAIWHGFVLLAASCHYAAVLACLPWT